MGKKRNSLSCHLCNFNKAGMVQCSIDRCSKCYCVDCIKTFLDNNFQNEKYKKQCWICYSCGKQCKCDICLGNLPVRKRQVSRKQKRPETQLNVSDKPLQNSQNIKDFQNLQQQNILKSIQKQQNFILTSKVKIQNQIQTQKLYLAENQTLRNAEKQKKEQKILQRQIEVKTQIQELSLTMKWEQPKMNSQQQHQITFYHYMPYISNIEIPRFTFFYF